MQTLQAAGARAETGRLPQPAAATAVVAAGAPQPPLLLAAAQWARAVVVAVTPLLLPPWSKAPAAAGAAAQAANLSRCSQPAQLATSWQAALMHAGPRRSPLALVARASGGCSRGRRPPSRAARARAAAVRPWCDPLQSRLPRRRAAVLRPKPGCCSYATVSRHQAPQAAAIARGRRGRDSIRQRSS